ncbi:MAG: TatD family hydrolase [bacterium]|nr:TatD family hydrolase [bacterium]
MIPLFFDVHSHLNFPEFDNDREEVIERLRQEGVSTITVGTDLATSESAVELTKHSHLFASVGFHPDEVATFDEAFLRELAQNERVVAIGECGLDYFRTHDNEGKQVQKNAFERQIALAAELHKPLMIHCREAYQDVYEMLASAKRSFGDRIRGNMHFFAGSHDDLRRFLDIGFSVSFTGVITFTAAYDEVVRFTPLSNLMAETDAPYVAPVPYRGKRNEPRYVKEVVKRIAEIKGLPLLDCREKLVENAMSFVARQ